MRCNSDSSFIRARNCVYAGSDGVRELGDIDNDSDGGADSVQGSCEARLLVY